MKAICNSHMFVIIWNVWSKPLFIVVSLLAVILLSHRLSTSLSESFFTSISSNLFPATSVSDDGLGRLCSGRLSSSLCPVAVHNFSNGIKILVFPKVTPSSYFFRVNGAGNLHEMDEELLFVRFIKLAPKRSVFVDIGAALGYYVILAKLNSPLLTIYAVNPQPVHQFLLRENLILNGISLENIFQIPFAISSIHNSSIKMGGLGLGGSIKLLAPQNNSRNEEFSKSLRSNDANIVGVSFSYLMEQYLPSSLSIYLVMIDIQGHEISACPQLTRSNTQRVSYIFIGTHTVESHTVCLAALHYIGMSVWEMCGGAIASAEQCQGGQHSPQPDGLLIASWSKQREVHDMFRQFPRTVNFIEGGISLGNRSEYRQVRDIVQQLSNHSGNWSRVVFEWTVNSTHNPRRSNKRTRPKDRVQSHFLGRTFTRRSRRNGTMTWNNSRNDPMYMAPWRNTNASMLANDRSMQAKDETVKMYSGFSSKMRSWQLSQMRLRPIDPSQQASAVSPTSATNGTDTYTRPISIDSKVVDPYPAKEVVQKARSVAREKRLRSTRAHSRAKRAAPSTP